MTILNITYGDKLYYRGEGYLPICAGGGRTDIANDNTGDNIADKNEVYGELTAVYWAWKNLKHVDYIGFSHYRRYLMPLLKGIRKSFPYAKTFYDITWEDFIKLPHTQETFLQALQSKNVDFIFAKRWHFEGLTIREQFLQHHPFPEDLELVRSVLLSYHPESVPKYDQFLKGSDAYCCCLFICSWQQFDHLCQWMFPVLFAIESQLDMSKYDSYQKRVIAFIYERLLNVYLATYKYQVLETPFYMIGVGKYKSILRQDIGARIWNIIRPRLHGTKGKN